MGREGEAPGMTMPSPAYFNNGTLCLDSLSLSALVHMLILVTSGLCKIKELTPTNPSHTIVRDSHNIRIRNPRLSLRWSWSSPVLAGITQGDAVPLSVHGTSTKLIQYPDGLLMPCQSHWLLRGYLLLLLSLLHLII